MFYQVMPKYRIRIKWSGIFRHRPSSHYRCYKNCAAGSKPF